MIIITKCNSNNSQHQLTLTMSLYSISVFGYLLICTGPARLLHLCLDTSLFAQTPAMGTQPDLHRDMDLKCKHVPLPSRLGAHFTRIVSFHPVKNTS